MTSILARHITQGFPPLAANNAHTLILGSLPSVQSIMAGEYYGNPRNAFWRIMGELFGAHSDFEYALRVDKLTNRSFDASTRRYVDMSTR